MSDTYTLADVAHALRMHPRTLARALTGTDGTRWFADRHGVANLNRVAKAFGTTPRVLRRILSGHIKLLATNEAARELGLSYDRMLAAVHSDHIVPTVARQRGDKQHWRFAADYIAALRNTEAA